MKSIVFCLIVILTTTSCLRPNVKAEPNERTPQKFAEEEKIEEKAEVVPLSDIIKLVAVGDNLFHEPMIRPSPSSYNFIPYYIPIKPLIEKADIAFINQETLLAGTEFGYSGYPQFNSPQEVGLALIETGFDIINHANNHVMDKGERAVFSTMDFWEKYPHITYLGIHRSQETRNKPIIIEKNNIKLGFLSYTYGTNGLPVPRDKPYLVSIINTEIMAREISALRPLCDFLIVSMHWGNEYEHTISVQQRNLSKFLAEQKVDLVIGHHPHVLQPVEFISRNDGKEMLCVFSLGNFISAQSQNPTLLGGLLYIEIKKDGELLYIENQGIVPVVTHYEAGSINFRVYPLYNYTQNLLDRHWNKVRSDLSLEYLNNLACEILGKDFLNYNPFAP